MEIFKYIICDVLGTRVHPGLNNEKNMRLKYLTFEAENKVPGVEEK